MYIAFGCLISFRQTSDSLKNKLVWIHQYLNAHFPDANHDVQESYNGVRNNGLNLNQLIAWCNKKVPVDQKIKLAEYLVQLANSDQDVNSNELVFIFFILKKWNIAIDEIDSDLQDVLLGKKEEKRASILKGNAYYFGILELPETASLLQVKRAYRKLVKMYHPDNHQHLSLPEKKIQVAKFMQVQQAYEILSSVNTIE